MVALPDSDAVSSMPFAFSMAMAVRHRDKELKAQLDSVIERRRSEITAILQEYAVPLLALHAPATGPSEHGTRSTPRPVIRDTGRDSLLVTDSVHQRWKWFNVHCFRSHGDAPLHPAL